MSDGNGQPTLTDAATYDDIATQPDLDRHAGREISNGELRARLQRVVPLKLTQPVLGLDKKMHFRPGDLVVAQYWGVGQVMITPARLEAGPPIMAVAHDIHAELY